MSGIEVAGLVLGGFPLLISAAEHYKEGFEPLLKWKRFRTEFISFIDAIDIEKQLFVNTIERFLIEADVPQDELKAFMTIPDYKGWEKNIQVFRSRLGPAYSAYISTINAMRGLMEELQGLLLLKDGSVHWAKEGESKWDYQMKRIQLSFGKKGTKTLSALEAHNRKLRELLDSNDKIHVMRAARKDATWGNIFERIRHHAINIHAALQNSWSCSCTMPHTAALRLQKRVTGGLNSQFQVDFSVPSKRPPLRREVLISVKDKEEDKQATPLPSPELDDTYLVHLRNDFEATSLGLSPRSSLRSPSPSESTKISVSSTTSTRAAFKDFFSIKHESSSNTTLIANSNNTQSLLSKRIKTTKKSVGFQAPRTFEVQCVEPDLPVIEAVTEVKIEDLCSALCSDIQTTCLGYVLDNEQRQYELRPLKQNQPLKPIDSYELVNLETLLSSTSKPKLNRQERYRIASILASSLLQLQSTPWLAEKLDKKNIYFFKDDSEILVGQPFINHSFISTKVTTPPNENLTLPAARRSAVRRSLNQLGIILLELCFGQAIEDQDIRRAHLGPDGTAHKETDYLTAIDWSDMVMGEEPELEPIINCCVSCAFQEKANWDNKQFIQEVYLSVVEPLEKLISRFARQ